MIGTSDEAADVGELWRTAADEVLQLEGDELTSRLATIDVTTATVLAARATDPVVLTHLASSRDMLIRLIVAKNPDTSPALLLSLALNDDWLVRSNVAKNPKVPATLLATLAADDEPQVRLVVATHAATPRGILEILAADPSALVRSSLLSRTDVDDDLRIVAALVGDLSEGNGAQR
jgi:hypothetical protein